MNINVNNCEAFFLDYYEGNLSEGQVAELFAFLKLHPQMREAFESFADVAAEDDHVPTPDFSFLKKEETVNEHEQAEMWMVELIENCISEEDRAALEKYFVAHPDRRKELAMFQQTILIPDSNEKLDSTSLLRKATTIHADNFSDFAVASVEGTITPADQKQLDAFIAAHPQYANELDLYRSTISVADIELFDAKESLKKKALTVNSATIDELLIAQLEGQLNSVESAAVNQFVLENPQYAKDVELLSKTIVRPDQEEILENRNKLYRGVASVTEENFEEMAIAASEGLLNAEELKAVNSYAAKSEKRRSVLLAYASIKAEPDMQVVFADRESLKRKDRRGFIWWNTGMQFAAAAVLILLLAVYVFVKYGSATSDQPESVIANNNSLPLQNNNQVIPVDSTNRNTQLNNGDDAVAFGVPTPATSKSNYSGNVLPVVNNTNRSVEFVLIPTRNAVNSIPNKGNDQVNFSDALYAVVFEPGNESPRNEYLSPGQIAMRWMKSKLDGTDADLKRNEALVKDTRAENRNDNNVDGLDLTESAVNRVGIAAANGNVSMRQTEDGTWLKLWKYNFRVGGRP